jgi:hypothetical protein
VSTNETQPPTILGAQAAARSFLEQSLPEVSRVSVTRVVKLEGGDGGWEVEADVWQPNPTIMALKLPTQRPVLDEQHCLVRLDNLLNVLAYLLEKNARNDG